ncbi:MAG: hypothetical protein ACMXX7_03120, partial [Candidatus Woesearchaeota archaeon]
TKKPRKILYRKNKKLKTTNKLKKMNKLKKIIQELNEQELIALKKDLNEGNVEILINKKLRKINLENQRRCPVCGEEILKDPYILEFGSLIRRKAYFDGTDCLSYFVQTKIKQKNL